MEIQQRLPDFMSRRLGLVATGEVQGHLLTCEACSDVYAELVWEEVENEVESGAELPMPPRIPPRDWYEAYLRGRSGRFGLMWESVRDALKSPDVKMKEWAREQMAKIGEALRRNLIPPSTTAIVHTRGAVRTRGNMSNQSRSTLNADVLSAALEPTGQTVSFTLEEAPIITSDGHFRLRLSTQTAGYEEHDVICTVSLPEMLPISFGGIIKRRRETETWEVEIDEEGVPCGAKDFAIEHMTVAVVKK
jgi:hypothetical protein